MRTFQAIGVITCAAAIVMAGCNGSDPEIRKQAASSGFSENAANELSSMHLNGDEMASVAEAKRGGMEDSVVLHMVRSLHDRDQKFDIGFALQLLKQEGVASDVLVQLVDMGAIPRMADDLRALKDARVADATLVEVARLRFNEKKTLLPGPEYGQLKAFGISDAGLVQFIRKGGTEAQLQQLSQDLALGTPEADALKKIGM
ncbi:MAG TPA: hypothetical protein VHI13_04750 [Candidatus Kapabacteria bacterium]|nr:hypothetical protein [Candidatus Kapabacteria bacterium]